MVPVDPSERSTESPRASVSEPPVQVSLQAPDLRGGPSARVEDAVCPGGPLGVRQGVRAARDASVAGTCSMGMTVPSRPSRPANSALDSPAVAIASRANVSIFDL